jgi:hypothetical protein
MGIPVITIFMGYFELYITGTKLLLVVHFNAMLFLSKDTSLFLCGE